MYPPPKLVLFSSTRVATSWSVNPYCVSSIGSTTIWNCFVCPPQVLTSLTPGIVRICPLITHSCRSLSSIAFIGPESVY